MIGTREILRAARDCFPEGPLLRRLAQQYRPLICPFDELVAHVPRNAAVLDIGCGDGLFLGLLVRLGVNVTGIGFDANAAAISNARAMANRFAANIRFLHLDARAAWPQGEFDVVSLIDVVHHVRPSEQRSVLRMAASKVKAGGILLYKDISGFPAWRGLPNRLHDLVIARELIHYVPVGRVESWLQEEGLEMHASATISRLWYPHDLRVFRKPSPSRA